MKELRSYFSDVTSIWVMLLFVVTYLAMVSFSSPRGGMKPGTDYWQIDYPETLIVKIYIDGKTFYLVANGESRQLLPAE